VIRVLVTERIRTTARQLPPEVREAVAKAIAEVGAAFGNPHQHRGLGLRKLARRSYEIRVQRQWRVAFVHDRDTLIAYDIMDHGGVALWLRAQRK
jgi:mRNA-degrading endonuclease RelE of RelBE toxin-antitoxin system